MDDILAYFAGDDAEAAIPWSRSSNAIRKTRQSLPDGQLFFDRILQLAQIDPVLYPPTDYPALRKIITAIDETEAFDNLKSDCLVYYLLKDYKDGREAAFAKAKRIPKRFVNTTDGYWHLDHQGYGQAIRKLSAPGVEPDFVSTIIETLASQITPASASGRLVHDFVSHASIHAFTQEDRKLAATACMQISKPAEALIWIRGAIGDLVMEGRESEKTAETASGTALVGMLEAALRALFDEQNAVPAAIQEMLYLPLQAEEDAIISNWVVKKSTLQLPSRSISTILQWNTSRLVAQGRYAEAIQVLTKAVDGLKTSDEAYRRAQDSLKELYAALPPMMQSLVGLSAKARQQNDGIKQSTTDSASGRVAQAPWLPQPQANLPAPRSLLDAQSNAATVVRAAQGGSKLDAATQLPMSAGGGLRGTQTDASIAPSGRKDSRLGLLSAVRRADSPAKPTAQDSTMRDASPFRTQRGSPFPNSPMQQSRPTVPAFGLPRPSSQATSSHTLDFGEQLRRFQGQQQESLPSTSTPRPPSRSDVQASHASTSKHNDRKKQLPPGAFPSSMSIGGSTIGERTDSEGSDDEEPDATMDKVRVKDFSDQPPQPPQQGARHQQKQKADEASESKAKQRPTRQRTESSKDLAAPTPAKKGKKGPPKVDPTPRRSKRLGSAAPSEPEMMHPDEESRVENSMVGRTRGAGSAKTPRRRRP